MVFYNNPKDNELFAAIGRMIICWAHLENILDVIATRIFLEYGNPLGETEQPVSISRKIAFIKKSTRKLSILATDEFEGFNATLDFVGDLADKRHDCIHGCVIDHTEGTGVANAYRLVSSKAGKAAKPITISPATLTALTLSILESAKHLQPYARRFLQDP